MRPGRHQPPSVGVRLRRRVRTWLLPLCALQSAIVYAQPAGLPEYQVKAAFLYNFAKFIDWPAAAFAGPDDPLTIGILGRDPFGSALELLRDETAKGRPLRIRHLDNLEDLAPCHVLFICASEKKRLAATLRRLEGTDVLTVGDTDGYAAAGVMINLMKEGKRVQFTVNVAAVGRSSLKLSSKLLRLARITGSRTEGEP